MTQGPGALFFIPALTCIKTPAALVRTMAP